MCKYGTIRSGERFGARQPITPTSMLKDGDPSNPLHTPLPLSLTEREGWAHHMAFSGVSCGRIHYIYGAHSTNNCVTDFFWGECTSVHRGAVRRIEPHTFPLHTAPRGCISIWPMFSSLLPTLFFFSFTTSRPHHRLQLHTFFTCAPVCAGTAVACNPGSPRVHGL